MTIDDPIHDPDAIDTTESPRDGAVDLVILARAPLDDSERHQGLLLNKLEAYLVEINSPEFLAQHGPPSPDRTRIIVRCTHEPHPAIRQILQNAVPWIEENNAGLALEVRP